ncbi:malonate decarboxylase holo-ACP synthase [Trinickia sp. LjRoot230]|uniref:malonate decarboxylase holo-ACP synthase n=1 Tax=Trinickia sp. LjRoot230 TaxID=3342288 RepID=UPI003ECDDC5B
MSMPVDTPPLIRPHDLLKLRRSPLAAQAPAWAQDAFSASPYAVVRRAPPTAGQIAIGLRGTARHERLGAWADIQDIETIITPEDLRALAPPLARHGLAPFVLLRHLAKAACLASYEWGPTGSTGFELATGVATVSASSDLDLVIRTRCALQRGTAAALHAHLQAHAASVGIRIDAQLETPAGAIALAEWATDTPRVMLRTPNGPRLIADPWTIDSVDHCTPGAA